MTWPPQDPHGTPYGTGSSQPPGPVDPPPWAGAAPVPPYLPPQQQPASPVTQPQDDFRQPFPQPSRPPAQQPAATTRVRYADWGERVGASLVDYAILIAPLIVLGPVSAISESFSSLAAMVWFGLAGYLAWLNGSKGQSPGKALMGLKVVRDADGSTLGGPVGLVRGAILLIMGGLTGGLLFALAVLWPAWDARKQALHDKAVSATVVAGYPRAKFSKQIFLP